jgi:DUF4097 and DUF4098 domain-containing protein YvlB
MLIGLLALLTVGCIIVNAQDSPPANFKAARHMTVAHEAGSGIKVTTGNGAVNIRKGDVSEVTIDAEIRAISQERLDAAKIIADRAGGKLNIEVAWPDGKPMGNEGCRFDIVVPDAKGVEVRTTNGAVTISGLGGEAIARSTNGMIKLVDHDGPAGVSSTNGRIELENVSGKTTATTTNGGVSVVGAKGSVHASSTNGSITVRLAGESAGPVNASSTNGGIEVTIGKTFAGTLSASTTNGHIDIPEIANARLVRVQKNSATVAIGQSNESSELRTTNGSIRVHAAQ